MTRTHFYTSASVVLTLCAMSLPALAQQKKTATQGTPAARTFFDKTVRPILEQHCYRCHSHQAKRPTGAWYSTHEAAGQKEANPDQLLCRANPTRAC